MPKAAIHTGAVDATAAPDEIARELLRICAHRPGRRPRRAHGHVDAYERIMRTLERQVGVDFFKYKQSTIRRRLERRLIATGCTSLEEYARYLERTHGEAQSLLQNMLTSVTSFFRDAEAFKALAQHVQERVRARRDGLKAILLTGSREDGILQAAREVPACRVEFKPLDYDALERGIQAVRSS